jgi:hypothetical protein
MMLTLSIRVVPAAPLIVNPQNAVSPEKLKVNVCVAAVSGSIGIVAAAVVATVAEIHTIAVNIAISLKILFICLSSIILFEVCLALCYI